MNHSSYKLNKSHSLTAKLFLSLALISFASVSIADESSIAYVDSVHQWGAWALDIEPAAGGLTQATTGALNARDSKVTLRTNSIAALAPPPRPAIPAPPIVPVAPVAPPVAPPVTPPTTPPIGGPTDGLF